MAVLLITHDLGVVAETAHRVVVMYTGRKVEEGTVREIFHDPRHPYTRGLLGAARWEEGEGDLLREIPGTVPSPFAMPAGCSFMPRCPVAEPRCALRPPEATTIGPSRSVRCVLAKDGQG
jgi:oligopeptide/dipeptide ABC transporter ATP-binding protein